MGFAYKVARITLNGTMFGGSEHWSTGFYMGATGADATAPTDAFLTEVNTAWQAFFQNSTSYISTSYQTTGVRGALLGTDGKTIAGSIKNFYPATPYAGGSNNSALPPQCALVATLMTDTPRGLASKGRMFLPGVSAVINGTGHLSAINCQSIVDNLKTFFAALNATVEQPGTVITASKGGSGVNLAPGLNRVIRTVRVGDVFDTQRRRRNELNEVYYTSTAL